MHNDPPPPQPSYCLSPEGGVREEDDFLGKVTWFTGGTAGGGGNLSIGLTS